MAAQKGLANPSSWGGGKVQRYIKPSLRDAGKLNLISSPGASSVRRSSTT